jgi:hypothetical protein
MINYDGSRDPHYDMIKNINADTKAIGGELLRAQTWAAYHVGAGAEYHMPPDLKSPVQVETKGRLTIGVFHHADGRTLALVANRDHQQNVTAIVHGVDGAFDARSPRWATTTSPVTSYLPPGGAQLFRCAGR